MAYQSACNHRRVKQCSMPARDALFRSRGILRRSGSCCLTGCGLTVTQAGLHSQSPSTRKAAVTVAIAATLIVFVLATSCFQACIRRPGIVDGLFHSSSAAPSLSAAARAASWQIEAASTATSPWQNAPKNGPLSGFNSRRELLRAPDGVVGVGRDEQGRQELPAVDDKEFRMADVVIDSQDEISEDLHPIKPAAAAMVEESASISPVHSEDRLSLPTGVERRSKSKVRHHGVDVGARAVAAGNSGSLSQGKAGSKVRKEGPTTLSSFVVDCFIVAGPSAIFLPQFTRIIRSGSVSGFSIGVPLLLIVGNLFKVHFWFGRAFSTVLLVQTIVSILVQAGLLWVCFRMAPSKGLPLFGSNGRIKGTNLMSYLVAMTAVTSFLTMQLAHQEWFVQTLGALTLICEANVVTPQVVHNFKTRNTQGLSPLVIMLWLTGDVIKTAYFALTQAPTQFTLCATFQFLIDVLVLVQILCLRPILPQLPATFPSDKLMAA